MKYFGRMRLPNPEEFNFKDCIIADDECWLITPKNMGVKWTNENARFRSCIVRKSDNFVISQGFKKFTNYGEQSAFEPWNDSWKIEARHKLDGSLLIVSRYKGEWILRTRGTIDARQLPNGDEIDLLIEKYKQFFKNSSAIDSVSALQQSWLFEWTTPSNIVVLRESDEYKLTLIGIIAEGQYYSQEYLDICGSEYKFDRPQKYEYNSLQECIADVSAWKGKEGVVLYSADGQILKKIKATEYCELHKLATGIKTVNHVLDVFMQSPKFTNYEDFYKYIETLLDYEIAEKCKPFIQEITDAYATFVKCTNRMRERMAFIHEYANRKEQAEVILQEFREWKTVVAFLLLDKREIDDKVLRKSLEYILEI
jgi:hypothetical protein